MWHLVTFLPRTQAIMGLGMPELIILAVIVLVLFGSRLPSVMRSLGSSVVSFKKGMKDAELDEDGRIENRDEK